MAEYIERHPLRLQFQHEHIVNGALKDHKTARAWEGALMLLEDAPTADVVEVRHGEWIRKEDDVCWWLECSLCSEPPPKNRYGFYYQSSYCPNCGAKMDGKGDGE